jgi:hypothetical protein
MEGRLLSSSTSVTRSLEIMVDFHVTTEPNSKLELLRMLFPNRGKLELINHHRSLTE